MEPIEVAEAGETALEVLEHLAQLALEVVEFLVAEDSIIEEIREHVARTEAAPPEAAGQIVESLLQLGTELREGSEIEVADHLTQGSEELVQLFIRQLAVGEGIAQHVAVERPIKVLEAVTEPFHRPLQLLTLLGSELLSEMAVRQPKPEVSAIASFALGELLSECASDRLRLLRLDDTLVDEPVEDILQDGVTEPIDVDIVGGLIGRGFVR